MSSTAIPNTGFATCDVCGIDYDYAPDAPSHACRPDDGKADRRGIMIGMALAAALLVRDFDRPALAIEIAGAAGIDAANLASLSLDDYDNEPLLKIL